MSRLRGTAFASVLALATVGAMLLGGCGGGHSAPTSAAVASSRAVTQPAIPPSTQPATQPATDRATSSTGATAHSSAPSSPSSEPVGPTPSAKPVTIKGAGSVAIRIPGAGTQDFATFAQCATDSMDFSGTAANGGRFAVVGPVLTANGFSGVSGHFRGTVTKSGSLRVFTGAQGVVTVKAQARC
jgi:hypothetical protein